MVRNCQQETVDMDLAAAEPREGTSHLCQVSVQSLLQMLNSDDDISVLEGEARSSRGGTAATTPSPPSAHGSRGPAGEGRSSGLRGGGGGSEGIIEIGDYDLEETDEEENLADGKEYNEHEDFDDEYRTSGARASEQQVNDEMTTVDAESSIAQENLQATDNRKGKDKEEQSYEEPPEKLHQQPQEDMEEAPYESFRSRERRPYVVTEGPSQQRKGDAAGKAGQEQEQESNRGQMPGLFPDSDFDESDAKPKGNPRPNARARDYARTYDDRKPRQARAGAAPESHFGYNRAGGAGQAKPGAKQRFNNEREAHRFPGKGFDFYDDYDEEDDPRGARAFHERMRRGPKFGPSPRFGRGLPRFHQPRPKPPKYANNQHRERQGGQHGNQFGGAPYVNKGTRRAAEDQRHWRRDTPRYSKDDSESFDTDDSTEDSSTSEESSDAGFLPKRKPQGKKAPPRSFADEYSSDSDRPAPRRRPKAGAGKSRARAESPPRRPSNRPNEGRRRANARGPPPPRYADVMKDVPPNHYARLGLSEDATAEEIKKASKKMRIQTHPDQVKKGNPNMTENELAKVTSTAANVGEAADVLEDPDKKREYDEKIREWKRKHGGRLPKEHA
ncbi:MAG: hypothetical protein Q9186_004566 [Xanthomendoza sp. 1 TL-2023]